MSTSAVSLSEGDHAPSVRLELLPWTERFFSTKQRGNGKMIAMRFSSSLRNIGVALFVAACTNAVGPTDVRPSGDSAIDERADTSVLDVAPHDAPDAADAERDDADGNIDAPTDRDDATTVDATLPDEGIDAAPLDSAPVDDSGIDAIGIDTTDTDTDTDADTDVTEAGADTTPDTVDVATNPDGAPPGRFCFTDFECASGLCDRTVNRCTVACAPDATSCPNADWTCGADALCHCTFRDYLDFCDGHDDDCDGEIDSLGCNGGRCVAGTCVCDVAGESTCGNYCADLRTNMFNCGACGNACSTRYCEGGVCTCPSTQTNCAGNCFSLDTDRQHCGSCDNVCAFDAQCVSGACICNNTALSACAGACVDLATSTAHCGACGNACPRGASCTGGSCRCPTTEPTVCANACVDLASDRQNCSACDTNCAVACNRSTCTTIAMLAAGFTTTLAVLADGAVRWWGADGVWGADRTHSLPGLASPVEIDGGNGFACARVATGGVVCWGDNSIMQLANGGTTASATPVSVFGLADVVDIALGSAHGCAVQGDGATYCWGANSAGQLGVGEYTVATWARRVRTTSVMHRVFAGDSFTCALGVDGASCWGHNFYGELGDGTNTERLTPVPVVGLATGVVSLATGMRHACALLDDATVRCWGDNSSGQLGDGTTTTRYRATAVPGLTDVVDIAAGYDFTVALSRDGSLRWWGRTPETLSTALFPGAHFLTPSTLAGFPRFTTIDAGQTHVCGFTTDGTAMCWGSNLSAQLGARVPGVTGTAVPTPVAL